MKRVKPIQTPERPMTLGAYSKNAQEIAAITICIPFWNDLTLFINLLTSVNFYWKVYSLPWWRQCMKNQKHHNANHQKCKPDKWWAHRHRETAQNLDGNSLIWSTFWSLTNINKSEASCRVCGYILVWWIWLLQVLVSHWWTMWLCN